MRRALASLFALAFALGCDARERLRDSLAPASPHERYARSLHEAGLDSTALGMEWSAAARVWAVAPPVKLPFRELGYFAPDKPRATSVRILVKRGQRLVADVQTQGSVQHEIFVDLFRIGRDSLDAPERVASAPEGVKRLVIEADSDAEFILRIQPELLRGIGYTLNVHTEPSLAFPVSGRDGRAIQSRFGAEREAGRRLHKGVDIFAPRGTPALASVSGRVWAGTNNLGGKVVFLWDERRNLNLYYAHLDTQLVTTGDQVDAGDTLGLIGNTGNARGTKPHLHFGIYRRGAGAIDPYSFLTTPVTKVPATTADTSVIGSLARVSARRIALSVTPDMRSGGADTLLRHTVFRVTAATERWYRVTLPDDRIGFVAAASTESLRTPIRLQRVRSATAIRDRPALDAAVTRVITGNPRLSVLGTFEEYVLVEDGRGGRGWITLQP